MDISILVDLDLHKFSGFGITDYSSGLTNFAFHNNNGNIELTQRAAIDISEDASDTAGLTERGRGLYYWETEANPFIVNDNDVYEQTQGSVAIGQITSGTERVTMLETIGTPRLVILDAQNNEAWWVNTPASSVTAITWGGLFPSTLCHGGAILDSYLIIMDEDGIIYNSAVDDPTTTTSTSFVEAERENDRGVYLGKHNDHVVAFGTRTIEFLYDARNPTGSPLSRRQDIMHNIGCADGLGVWENGDVTYFVGSNPAGQIAVYRLENFNPVMISGDTLNSYLTQGLTQENYRVVLSGRSAMGQDELIMTIYVITNTVESGTHTGINNAAILTDSTKSWITNEHVDAVIDNNTDGSTGIVTANDATTVTVGAGLSGGTDNDFDTNDAYTLTGVGVIDPKLSLCYNSLGKKWGFINTAINGHTQFPLIAFTKRTGGQNATESARSGEGIFSNGDIFSVTDKLIPVDSLLGTLGIYEEGIYEPGIYLESSSDVGTNIDFVIRTGHQDGGIRGYKFSNFEYIMMDTTENSQTLTVKHADEGSSAFTTFGTIDTSNDKKELYQGGRFWQRNYQLEYSGNEQVFMANYAADLEAGD